MDDFSKEEMNKEFYLSELNDFRFLFNSSSDLSYGDDSMREEFSCPFCSLQCDLFSLPSHMELEHRFESKPTICPVCKEEISVEIFKHFSSHHRNVFRSRLRQPNLKSSRTYSNPRRASVSMSDENIFTKYSDPFPRSIDSYPPPMPTKSHRTLRSALSVGLSSGSGSGSGLNPKPDSVFGNSLNSKWSFDSRLPLENSSVENENERASTSAFTRPTASFAAFADLNPQSLSQDALKSGLENRGNGVKTFSSKESEDASVSRSEFCRQVILSTIFDEM